MTEPIRHRGLLSSLFNESMPILGWREDYARACSRGARYRPFARESALTGDAFGLAKLLHVSYRCLAVSTNEESLCSILCHRQGQDTNEEEARDLGNTSKDIC